MCALSLLAIRVERPSSREIGIAFEAPRAPVERPEPPSSRFSFYRRRIRRISFLTFDLISIIYSSLSFFILFFPTSILVRSLVTTIASSFNFLKILFSLISILALLPITSSTSYLVAFTSSTLVYIIVRYSTST